MAESNPQSALPTETGSSLPSAAAAVDSIPSSDAEKQVSRASAAAADEDVPVSHTSKAVESSSSAAGGPEARTNFEQAFVLRGHTHSISRCRFSAHGRFIASSLENGTQTVEKLAPFCAAADRKVILWDTFSGEQVRTLVGHSLGLSDVSWSHDERCVATASDDRTCRIFDVETGKCLCTLRGHRDHVFSVDYSPRANIVATGSSDETVRLWDVRMGESIAQLPAHSEPVTSVEFSPDGSVLASCSYDGLCRLWDVAGGECLRTLVDDSSPSVAFATFSPNGRYLLAATLDSRLRMWDYVENECVRTFEGHKGHRFCASAALSSSPVDSTALAIAGSECGKVFVWDVQNGAVSQTLQGHETPVLAVDAHPFRDILVSGSLEPEPVLHVWVDKSRGNGF